jgi:hypothetical protein
VCAPRGDRRPAECTGRRAGLTRDAEFSIPARSGPDLAAHGIRGRAGAPRASRGRARAPRCGARGDPRGGRSRGAGIAGRRRGGWQRPGGSERLPGAPRKGAHSQRAPARSVVRANGPPTRANYRSAPAPEAPRKVTRPPHGTVARGFEPRSGYVRFRGIPGALARPSEARKQHRQSNAFHRLCR